MPFNASYTLRIDENGDGSVDYELASETQTLEIEYDIGIVETLCPKTVAGHGYSLYINTTFMNYGAYSESFNATAYVNATLVGSLEATLPAGQSTTSVFNWNTTGLAKGNYSVTVYASPIPNETCVEDNTLLEGWIFVSIPGDINADKKVDLKDVYAVGKAFGTTRPGPNPPGPCTYLIATSTMTTR